MNVNPRIAQPSRNSKAMITGAFVRNAWYVAMWGDDLPREQVTGRTILNEAVALFRKADGSVAALADRCAHRFAPLHMGKVVAGDRVQCAYHGLEFDGSGACVLNPHGNKRVPPSARVRSYPVVEKHRAIWIWMGDKPADLVGHPRFRPARHAASEPRDEARLDQDQGELRARDRQPARSQPHVVSARRALGQPGHGRCRDHRRAGRRRGGGRPSLDEFNDPGAVRHPDAGASAGRQVEHDPLDRAGQPVAAVGRA